MNAPGELRDITLKVRGWKNNGGGTELACELPDGCSAAIPARWTDLPWREEDNPPLGVLASPPAWRALLERGEGLRERRPRRAQACAKNGGEDVGTAGARDRRADGGAGGGVGDAAGGEPRSR